MIKFNEPYYTGNEIVYMQDSLTRKKLCGDGFYTNKVSEFMEKTFKTKKALMTTSCSMALDMSCILAELKEGDEVILPSYTFVSTANSVVLRGAKCIFADIDKQTLVIDLDDVEKKITNKTKAIIAVHYAGVSCDMDRLMEIGKKYGVIIIEDAAQAVNAKYKGRYLGTIGDMGCYSFHETKNYVCGEGGALLINADNSKLISDAEIVREKGTNRSNFYRGQVDKYTWVKMGSSYLPSDILAAFLLAQFEKMEEINELRGAVFNRYFDRTEKLEKLGLVRRPFIPEYNDINYHMFYLITNSNEERNNLLEAFKKEQIVATFHYLPLHTAPMGLEMGYKEGDLPVTEDLSARLIRLPLYADLTEEQIDKIVKVLYDFFGVEMI